MRSRSSRELIELEGTYCSQGDTSGKRKHKKYFVRAEGSFLFDSEGKRYLDFQMFNSAANFGYQNPLHIAAAERQLHTLPGLASEFMHAERIELSYEIASRIEARFGVKGRVHFSVGGAQAIEDALKLVANYTGSRDVFAFEGSYHGRTIAASAISSSYRYRRRFGHTGRANFVPFPYCFRCPWGKSFPTCNYHCVEQFKRLFASEYHGVYDPATRQAEFRAFFLEPVLGRGGYVVPPPDYFRRLKQILTEYGILFVVDEIQMGFFRTGKLWAIENFDVIPDILVFGKAISNGLSPLAGIWAREELIAPDIWPPGTSHATFAAHPLSTAAGLATFELIDREDFERTIADRSERLRMILNDANARFAVFGRIDVLGLAAGLEICYPGSTEPAPHLARQISETALTESFRLHDRDYGLILTTGGYHNHVLMLSPSVLISHEELDLFGKLFDHFVRLALETV